VESVASAPTIAKASTPFFSPDDNFRPQPQLGARFSIASIERGARRIHIKLLAGRYYVPSYPHFIEKWRVPAATRSISAGEHQSGILMGAKKRQNKIWEYREMLAAWRKAKVMIWPADNLGFTDRILGIRIRRDIENRQSASLPIDIMEFNVA
jgi:hypothetical protein